MRDGSKETRAGLDEPATAGAPGSAGAPEDELGLVEALRAGDEKAFAALVERHHASMVRFARSLVPNATTAEDVVQEAWLGVLRGLDRFEGRSSLRTWIFRILLNTAMTRRTREARTIPFSALGREQAAGVEPAVDRDAFRPPGDRLEGHWTSFPSRWSELPDDRLLSGETLDVVREAVEGLPPAQRTVITLRDVEGWTAAEVCNALDISETNQRVLLHRARSRIRRALEAYL